MFSRVSLVSIPGVALTFRLDDAHVCTSRGTNLRLPVPNAKRFTPWATPDEPFQNLEARRSWTALNEFQSSKIVKGFVGQCLQCCHVGRHFYFLSLRFDMTTRVDLNFFQEAPTIHFKSLIARRSHLPRRYLTQTQLPPLFLLPDGLFCNFPSTLLSCIKFAG